MAPACLILSDAHLSRGYGHGGAEALARLLESTQAQEVILAGDIFDLSLDSARVPVEESARSILLSHPALVRALHAFTRTGGKLTLVPGNHDAGLGDREALSALQNVIQPPDDRQLEIAPWFIRRGQVHIEHGHLYDPDCAPNHPLAPPDPTSEGLGTALMRRFIAPNDAMFFAHAHTTTPASGLRQAFDLWGAKAPLVIARYFGTALSLCAETLTRQSDVQNEKLQGYTALAAHAERTGIPEEALHQLLSQAPRPTHHGFSDTFLRLYFDRIFAGLSLGVGITTLGAVGLGAAAALPVTSATGALLTALGGGYLGQSLIREKERYPHGPVSILGEAAGLVRDTTGANLVVFGHTHVEVDEPGYINLGSFGFGRPARPYIFVDEAGKAERRFEARE